MDIRDGYGNTVELPHQICPHLQLSPLLGLGFCGCVVWGVTAVVRVPPDVNLAGDIGCAFQESVNAWWIRGGCMSDGTQSMDIWASLCVIPPSP